MAVVFGVKINLHRHLVFTTLCVPCSDALMILHPRPESRLSPVCKIYLGTETPVLYPFYLCISCGCFQVTMAGLSTYDSDCMTSLK